MSDLEDVLKRIDDLETAWNLLWEGKGGPSPEAINALAQALRGLVSGYDLSDAEVEGFVKWRLTDSSPGGMIQLIKGIAKITPPPPPEGLRPAGEFLSALGEKKRNGRGRKGQRHYPPDFYVFRDVRRVRRRHYTNFKSFLIDVVQLLIDQRFLTGAVPGLAEKSPWTDREEAFTAFDLPDGTELYVYTAISAQTTVQGAITLIRECTGGKETLMFPADYRP